jgi:hypothetical protein
MFRNLPLPLYMIETGHADQAPATRDAQHAPNPAPNKNATTDNIKLKLVGLFNHDRPTAPPVAQTAARHH